MSIEGRRPGDELEQGPAREPAETPKITPIKRPLNVTALSVAGILILFTFYTLYFARAFLVPVVMALLLSMLLRPVVRGLHRLYIPEALGAAIVLMVLVLVTLAGLMLVAEPASKWVAQAPETLEKVHVKINGVINSARKFTRAAESVQQMTESPEGGTTKVEIKSPGILRQAWGQAKGALVMLLEIFVLLYFFLAAGDIFTLKLIQILPRLQDKKRALEMARETQASISQYLVSMTLVNLIEGTAIGTGLALLGLPNPLLWGVLAFSANYIPYVGAVIAASIVTIVSLTTFDSVGYALIAPLIYFGVNFTDNFLGPYIVGKRLVLNPVVVFLAVMFWGWIWGLLGVLLAVPMTMAIKIVCDHNAVLAPFAEFLTGNRSEKTEEEPMLKSAPLKGNA
jgi:predicted PurR-regulated permease PerM